jgi:hypothetical protein
MDVTWVFVWVVIAVFSLGYLGFLLYQLFYKGKKLITLSVQLQKESAMAREAAENDQSQYQPAKPTQPHALFALLGQRRKRKRQIERKKRERQRRLIARISKIEIDERFR